MAEYDTDGSGGQDFQSSLFAPRIALDLVRANWGRHICP